MNSLCFFMKDSLPVPATIGEVHFGQPMINPDSPRVSPQPDLEDTIQGEAD